MRHDETELRVGECAPVVLLVEDNLAMRALIRSLVEESFPTIHECGDGASAVALFTRFRPDWVLMDITLDGVDGITATRAIRRLDPTARIVIVTEHGDDAHRQAAITAGAVGFVLKENLLELKLLLSGSGAGAR